MSELPHAFCSLVWYNTLLFCCCSLSRPAAIFSSRRCVPRAIDNIYSKVEERRSVSGEMECALQNAQQVSTCGPLLNLLPKATGITFRLSQAVSCLLSYLSPPIRNTDRAKGLNQWTTTNGAAPERTTNDAQRVPHLVALFWMTPCLGPRKTPSERPSCP